LSDRINLTDIRKQMDERKRMYPDYVCNFYATHFVGLLDALEQAYSDLDDVRQEYDDYRDGHKRRWEDE